MNTFSTIMLVVMIVTGSGKPNIESRRSMPDMATCEEAMHEFLHHKFPEMVDAKGLVASCQGKLAEDDPS
jgi:hypothetical protein